MTHTDGRARPAKPLTLAIDVGGSHLKAAVLKASRKISTGPLRVETPKPATPDAVVSALVSLSQQLGQFDRVSIGFPGVVRADFVLTAPNLGTKEWHGFRLGAVLAKDLGKPVRILNDASIQGLAVITGRGLECVLHLELSQTNMWARRRLSLSAGGAGTNASTRLSLFWKPFSPMSCFA
jgi:polyphosphate glucokinase